MVIRFSAIELKKQYRFFSLEVSFIWIGIFIAFLMGEAGLIAFCLIGSVSIIPTMFIYIQYLLDIKPIVFDWENNEIIIESKVKKIHKMKDIVRVKLFKNESLLKIFSSLLDYFFVRIYFMDGSHININCLMIHDYTKLMWLLRAVKHEKLSFGPMFLFRK